MCFFLKKCALIIAVLHSLYNGEHIKIKVQGINLRLVKLKCG
ncbi:hypothetical protein CGSHi3655_05904 [Haemophilus influenzae 3655]|uniref:Uncharacterized protein n=2 Tax=Haemophilus influenzae TaxID=727 RepID=A5UIW1_HAEIG|nr:hypothetical protein CGSHiGG_09705 [Haemophilus influenzae PittGG]EDJ92877.1 hypothetical protein CGSHi3655_05904 [Haemophilus influenzae 3655]EDK09642.1 hypothetical protein CGSHiHH_02273 [Haemophilus influenzae PittHH]